MALGSTHPLTEMSARSISWGNIPGNHNFLEPSGPLQACNRTALPLLLVQYPYRHLLKFLFFCILKFINIISINQKLMCTI